MSKNEENYCKRYYELFKNFIDKQTPAEECGYLHSTHFVQDF